METSEGVIKFTLDYHPGPAIAAEVLKPLAAWRRIFHQLALIGQDPNRYGGYAYGNLSLRLAPDDEAFVITGTQTSGLPEPGPEHYSIVRTCDPARNHVVAEGPIEPSSECLTHGVLYQLDPAVQAVMHAHTPVIWNQRQALHLPATDADIPYGTPEMAAAVQALVRERATPGYGLFAMAGHEDGVVSYGRSAAEAGLLMVGTLAAALAL